MVKEHLKIVVALVIIIYQCNLPVSVISADICILPGLYKKDHNAIKSCFEKNVCKTAVVYSTNTERDVINSLKYTAPIAVTVLKTDWEGDNMIKGETTLAPSCRKSH